MDAFLNIQTRDIMKKALLLTILIKIDYTQADNIEFHIRLESKLRQSLYLSTPELYTYLN